MLVRALPVVDGLVRIVRDPLPLGSIESAMILPDRALRPVRVRRQGCRSPAIIDHPDSRANEALCRRLAGGSSLPLSGRGRGGERNSGTPDEQETERERQQAQHGAFSFRLSSVERQTMTRWLYACPCI
jgi:hypothetical protein